jgi:hypothetical protein
MPKPKTNSKSYKEIAQTALITVAVLYGVYWAAIGITGTKASWVDVVSNIILIIIVICGGLMGILPGSKSKR